MLKVLDLSNNRIGFRSKAAIERVNANRLKPLALEMAGNLVLTEALNVLTHGAGTVLAVVGVRSHTRGLCYSIRGVSSRRGAGPILSFGSRRFSTPLV